MFSSLHCSLRSSLPATVVDPARTNGTWVTSQFYLARMKPMSDWAMCFKFSFLSLFLPFNFLPHILLLPPHCPSFSTPTPPSLPLTLAFSLSLTYSIPIPHKRLSVCMEALFPLATWLPDTENRAQIMGPPCFSQSCSKSHSSCRHWEIWPYLPWNKSHPVKVSALFFMGKLAEISVHHIKSIFVIRTDLTSPAACECVRENVRSLLESCSWHTSREVTTVCGDISIRPHGTGPLKITVSAFKLPLHQHTAHTPMNGCGLSCRSNSRLYNFFIRDIRVIKHFFLPSRQDF